VNSTARYHLPDEPHPGALAANVVNPVWPFFAFMLVGPWFGIPWFAFNSVAMGSPTFRREAIAMGLAVVGSVLLLVAIIYAMHIGLLDKQSARYAVLGMVALRLGCCYAITILQSRVFELHTYFGGGARNGSVVLILGLAILRPLVVPLLGSGLLGLALK
jgi:hypothetical protein